MSRVRFERPIPYWPTEKQLELPLPEPPLPLGAIPLTPSEVAALLDVEFEPGAYCDCPFCAESARSLGAS